MKKVFLVLVLLMGLMSCATVAELYSQTIENKEIQEVYIRGNATVSGAVIRRYLKLTPGRMFRMSDANEDIKRLYETGYFSKIDIDFSETETGQVILTYNVEEKPVIKKLTILGNNRIKTKRLLKVRPISEEKILNENKLAEGKEAIRKYYEDRGYMGATVELSYQIDEDANTAEVLYSIEEEKRIKIKKIEILGAKVFKPRKVRKAMKTKSKFFIIRQGYLKQSEFKDDLERIKALYYREGYIDIKILDVKKELTVNKKYLNIYITVHEGSKYKINNVTYEGNTIFPDDELAIGNILLSGEYFIPENLTDDLKRIEHLYYQKGYIDTRVGVDTVIDETTGGMNVKYYINEGIKVYVNKIRTIGNMKTKDIVLRREIIVAPGEVFDGVKTEISENRLNNLGLFEKVEIYPDPESKEEYRDLIIGVEEGRTGELSFGAGFSSVENFMGFIEIAQNNFDLFNWPHLSGDAQKLKLRMEYGEVTKDLSLSFVEPWFLDKKLSFGFDLYDSSSSYIGSVFDEERTGGGLSLAWPVGRFSRMTTRYGYEEAEITNVSPYASDQIKNEEGLRTISKIGLSLTRDTRNSYYYPTQGMQTTIRGEVAGIGGNTEYYETAFSHYSFFSFFDDHVFMIKFKTSLIEEYGDSLDVPLFDKYFIGGPTSIRGFKYRDIGPHDINDDPIGGKYYAYTTFEYTIPIFKRLGIATFFDVGNLYSNLSDADFGDLNGSVGIGLRIKLPIGPISFDYGYPVITDDFHSNENGVFTFNLGTTF